MDVDSRFVLYEDGRVADMEDERRRIGGGRQLGRPIVLEHDFRPAAYVRLFLYLAPAVQTVPVVVLHIADVASDLLVIRKDSGIQIGRASVRNS